MLVRWRRRRSSAAVKDRQHPFVGHSYWPRFEGVERNCLHHCLVDPALRSKWHFTPHSKTRLKVRECGQKNSCTPVSLAWPHFAGSPMQSRTEGVMARLVNLRWGAVLSRGSIVSQLPGSRAHFIQGWRANFTWVRVYCGGIRWWNGIWFCL